MSKNRTAIIGAGVSGLTMARLLSKDSQVTVFEASDSVGGLIRCERVEGSLFHTCGGHVFNTKRADVLEFFKTLFDLDADFLKADRNSTVIMPDGCAIPYPIENHAYLFDDEVLKKILDDILALPLDSLEPTNFEEFLVKRFGPTLYNLYFAPYNRKIWRRSLSSVPLSWLEGKLPMPTPAEILFNNVRKVKEKVFVHSTFWYEKACGSQFLADRLAEGLDIRLSTPVTHVSLDPATSLWRVNGQEFERVVFCGNLKMLPRILGAELPEGNDWIESLEYHGTTTVFCEIAPNPYSWIYLPDERFDAHRIICTGNFSPSNNATGKMTGTVEFTDEVPLEAIMQQLTLIPYSPRYITHRYNPCTYPIQDSTTRGRIAELKKQLAPKNFYLTGRFADWEYYNMDVAMGAAFDTVARYNL